MPFEVTERNASALEPLFKPWEQPTRYRRPNPVQGKAALIEPGRRPSKVPQVERIREQVDLWRNGGYGGVSDTSRHLLNHWFTADHQIASADGTSIAFRYHWAQREAIETIIFLYELRRVRNVAELLFEFGNEAEQNIALGIDPVEDQWARYCTKIATGGGKTKVMSLLIVWSYFHSLYEPNSDLARHFVVIAPNLTVYERLKDDFEYGAIFHNDPLLPPEWKSDFQMQVVLQDEPGGTASQGTIYLTNIHRLYDASKKTASEPEATDSIFGPSVKRAQVLDTGAALRERIMSHKRIMVINDEAHHLHDPDLAWSRAIDTLHEGCRARGGSGVCLQLDCTATPRHNNGDLFRHIVCDFPLGEAVDAGIVKVPVLGESDDLIEHGDKETPAHERFSMHLQLGYQRYVQTFNQFKDVRKPVLFVMTEDAQAANEVAAHLDSDDFPLLKGRVLNIHTRLQGKLKKVKRGGREIIEFVEDEKKMKPDDLRALRELSRSLDTSDSPYRCVVSVMMLREGWDVRNVTTIVPLRPYSAKSGILPEQTLGRGLRRMFPQGDVPELVTVVHHPAFRKLYEDELAQEGLDIAVMPLRTNVRQSVTIFVDHERKPVDDLEIELPLVSEAFATSNELQGLTFDEVRAYFRTRFQRLPIGKKKEGVLEYKERHLFTDEVISRMRLDAGLLNNGWSAPSYFVQMLSRACHLSNAHGVLAPLVEQFLSEELFEHKINLYGGEVDHRMSDIDVIEHVRATFTPLILQRTVQKTERTRSGQTQRLSRWKPFQATSTEQRPAVPAQRTLFNLVPCDNAFEQEFADFCDYASDIAAFAKNTGPQKLMIDYLRPDGHRALYVPDFVVRSKDGAYILVELKGRVDAFVPLKVQAADEWCKAASNGATSWNYLYVPYQMFQEHAPSRIDELLRACRPSLQALLDEAKTKQLSLIHAKANEPDAHDLLTRTLKEAGVNAAPEAVEDPMRQAVQLLDYAVRSKMRNYAHAFQVLLEPLDEYAIQIIEKQLAPRVPSRWQDQRDYFDPPLLVDMWWRRQLEKNQRYLEQNLVQRRSIQKLGTLLFCLDYAQRARLGVDGVWRDVERQFVGSDMNALYKDLKTVNDFRNTYVAHIEQILDDAGKAWEAMRLWLRCVARMVTLAS